jgi:DNA-binding MarR family transcriptional regulator
MLGSLIHLFDEVRLLDHRLIQVAELLHSTIEVSIPGRAVLEFLERSGPAAVPDIARARYVTRQHIQTTVDVLADRGLVQSKPNRAHRRSPLFALTNAGASTISSMHERERQLLERRMAAINSDDVLAAATLLAAVRTALDDEEIR